MKTPTARVLNAITLRQKRLFVPHDGAQYPDPYSPLSNWERVAPAILEVLLSPGACMNAREVAAAAALSPARTAAALQYGVRQGVLRETFKPQKKGSGLKVLYSLKPNMLPDANGTKATVPENTP